MKEHKETIFDYNPTDTELKRFGGRESFEYERKHGFNRFDNDNDRYYCLALLFSMRGDKEKFLHYCELIPKKSMLRTFMQDF